MSQKTKKLIKLVNNYTAKTLNSTVITALKNKNDTCSRTKNFFLKETNFLRHQSSSYKPQVFNNHIDYIPKTINHDGKVFVNSHKDIIMARKDCIPCTMKQLSFPKFTGINSNFEISIPRAKIPNLISPSIKLHGSINTGYNKNNIKQPPFIKSSASFKINRSITSLYKKSADRKSVV